MPVTSLDLTALRDALLDLPSSGPDGFEGLLATVFAKILGVPFRLAKSGSQFGVDGKASDPAFPVAFEAKRYRGDVPSSEVLNKIGSLAIRGDPVELWILGTTGLVSSQVADDLGELARIHGFSTLILDWQSDAPRLAAVLIEAGSEVSDFLIRNVPTSGLAAKAIAEIQSHLGHSALKAIAHSTIHQLRAASVAAPMAQDANHLWLHETLSNRMRAKSRLGQVLTPLGAGGAPILSRSNLLDELQTALKRSSEARVIAVLGDEGNGKSWLATKACIQLPTTPLVLVFSSEEFVAIPEGVNWDEVLAQKLLTQTGESFAEHLAERWRRRFERWRNADATQTPRIFVLVDGLNQRPAVAWGRHIDSLAFHIHELGGCILVTCRSAYFQRHVEPRLISPVTQIHVPPWTAQERDEVLAKKGIVGASLRPAVAMALLNPRLLGIALTLLDADTLESLDTLSVTWLFFEHLRLLDRERSDGHSAIEFADMLQRHAKDILARVRSESTDNLTIFDNLEPASEGRFFQWVNGEPHRYTLRDDGLTYALALAIIEELRAAVRNGKDVQEALQAVLEPIAALDQTADATIAAITIACLDQQISEPIGVALLAGFAQLQNPDVELAASLAGIAHKKVRIFCEACEVLRMSPTAAPNTDWLEASLHATKRRPEAWKEMLPFLDRWLRYWWPDIRVNYKVNSTQRSPIDERRDAEAERDQQINSLNEIEHKYLSQLIRRQEDPHRLVLLALQICAQMPLEPLVGSLACASFSFALTPTHFSPNDSLSSLILFNRCDWTASRNQFVAHAEQLASSGTSVSGRWAAVTLLRATGALVDSIEAHRLVLELTKDRERFTPWRRVESYCATDPCNPASDRPDNIEDTARKYAELDVGKLKIFMGVNEYDHFVESALPGLARFSPDIAVQKHREFLASVPSRRGLALRQATWATQDDAVLIDHVLAGRLLALSTSLVHDKSGIDEASVVHVQQALLLSAFPKLSSLEQFAGVDAIPDPNCIWMELMQLVKEDSCTQLMELVQLRGSSNLQAAVPLAFAGSISTVPLHGFATILPELLKSPHTFVRSAALHLARVTGDIPALEAVVASGWTFGTVSRSTREYVTGSLTLIEAAKRGVATGCEILPRIAPETYGAACAQLDDTSVEQLAVMLDACVRAASICDAQPPPVEIVRTVMHNDDVVNSRYSLEEISATPKSFADELDSDSDDESGFYVRRRKLHESYENFERRLTPEVAALVLEAFELKDLHTILRVAPNLVYGWGQLVSESTPPRRRALRNLGIYLGCALTHGEKSSVGVALLSLLQDDASFVQVQYTQAGLPLEAVAFWWAADNVEVDRLRFARLDACVNDYELALEVATAIYAGKSAVLKAYVQERLGSLLPVDVARAVTVAGFSNDATLSDDAVASFDGDEGLLVMAARSSRDAMDRYRWSKHWFDKMLVASTEEIFWTASILFLKVVDVRFDAEHQSESVGSIVFNTWWWSVERRLRRRFEKWADKRKNTLFGSKVPDSIYLTEGH